MKGSLRIESVEPEIRDVQPTMSGRSLRGISENRGGRLDYQGTSLAADRVFAEYSGVFGWVGFLVV